MGFEPTIGLPRYLISSQGRYDHFDTLPYFAQKRIDNIPQTAEKVKDYSAINQKFFLIRLSFGGCFLFFLYVIGFFLFFFLFFFPCGKTVEKTRRKC